MKLYKAYSQDVFYQEDLSFWCENLEIVRQNIEDLKDRACEDGFYEGTNVQLYCLDLFNLPKPIEMIDDSDLIDFATEIEHFVIAPTGNFDDNNCELYDWKRIIHDIT